MVYSAWAELGSSTSDEYFLVESIGDSGEFVGMLEEDAVEVGIDFVLGLYLLFVGLNAAFEEDVGGAELFGELGTISHTNNTRA